MCKRHGSPPQVVQACPSDMYNVHAQRSLLCFTPCIQAKPNGSKVGPNSLQALQALNQGFKPWQLLSKAFGLTKDVHQLLATAASPARLRYGVVLGTGALHELHNLLNLLGLKAFEALMTKYLTASFQTPVANLAALVIVAAGPAGMADLCFGLRTSEAFWLWRSLWPRLALLHSCSLCRLAR